MRQHLPKVRLAYRVAKLVAHDQLVEPVQGKLKLAGKIVGAVADYRQEMRPPPPPPPPRLLDRYNRWLVVALVLMTVLAVSGWGVALAGR